ncbi:hypothetical protein Tco_1243331 [Tanacetum coccineum]
MDRWSCCLLCQDSPLTKLTNTVVCKYKFGMEIPGTMINDAIKQSDGYKYYKHKRIKSEKAKLVEEPKEQNISTVKSDKGKGYMGLGDQEVNVTSAFKKNDVPRKTRSLTIADNIVEEPVAVKLVKSIRFEDQRRQQHLRKGLKANGLESLKQATQVVGEEGSSGTHNKYYQFENISATDSEATQDSSRSNTNEERDDEIDDSDMDLSEDEPKGGDDAAGFGVFVYNKCTEPLKSTCLNPIVTTLSLEYIQSLLNEPPANELTNFLSNPVYTDAHTTSVVANPDGNPEEMFLDEAFHHISSPPANIQVKDPQPSSLQAKAKKLMQKAKKNMRKINFKRAVTQRFKEYDQKLKALTSINVSEAIDKAVRAKVLTEIKKLLPTYVSKVLANYVNPRFNNSMLEVMQNNQIRWFTKKSGLTGAAKRRTTCLDLFLKSDIDQNENHILGPSTVAIAKKLKELIEKDELTIADLEGAGLEKQKQQYKNDVELEYHIDQLKAAMSNKAQWNTGEGGVSKPISSESHMSKSTIPHFIFYNNDF